MNTLKDMAIAGLAALVVNCLLLLPLFNWVPGLSHDVLFWMRQEVFGPPKSDEYHPVSIIAVDEETYRRPPFKATPRVMWTPQFADVTNALIDAGALVVGYDLILPTSVESLVPGFERPFLLALREASRSNKIVLAKAQHQAKPVSPFAAFSFAVGHEKNIRATNVFEDEDGIVRRVPLKFKSIDQQGHSRFEPSLSLELAQRAVGHDHFEAPDPMTVNFAIGPRGIPTYSLADIHSCVTRSNNDFLKTHFAKKVVLIGTFLDVGDRLLSSMRMIATHEEDYYGERCDAKFLPAAQWSDSVRDSVPGVVIQAFAVRNLLKGDWLREPSRPVGFFLCVCLSFIASFWVLRLPPIRAYIVIGAGVITWVFIATAAMEARYVLPMITPILAAALCMVVLFAYRFSIADRDRAFIRQAFSLYLPKPVIDRLVARTEPPELGGEIRELTILFTDLADFTSLSEQLSPKEVVNFLNRYLSVVADIVERHGGFVDKYVGDAVIAVFGAPEPDPDHATNGVLAAIEIDQVANDPKNSFGLPAGTSVSTRIGVNTGNVVVGNVGSKRRFNYTVIGDAVNVASRLEAKNKSLGTTLVVGASTVERCRDGIDFREIDSVQVRGRLASVRVFEPTIRKKPG